MPVTIRTELEFFERRLRKLGTRKRAEGEKRYLKSDLDFLGATTPDIRKLVRAWLKEHDNLSRTDLVRLVKALWRRPVHELRRVAMLLLDERWSLLESSDIELLEWLLRRSNTWAYVDGLAVHIVGRLVELDSKLTKTLDRWARDDDFWIRRSGMLALLLPLRRGEGDWKRFTRYADSMLDEKEFFIRKAIGWVLRETSKKTPKRVAEFLEPRLARISGVTFREAVKYLPATTANSLKRRRLAGLR